MITIYNFPRGLRGIRVFWLCEEMGLPYRAEAVSFPTSEAYRTRHPLGNVPFLEDGDVAINESVAMLLYLAEKYGPTSLLPGKDDPAFARVLQMTVFSEAALGAGMNLLIQTRFMAPDADKRNWSSIAQEQRLEQAFGYVEAMLGGNPYLAGDSFTLADIAISTACGLWVAALGKSLPERLAAYHARMTARPGYQRALKAQ
jgi:glutathione S-transferase